MSIKKLLDIQGFTRVVNGKIQYVRRHGRNQNVNDNIKKILSPDEIDLVRSYTGSLYMNFNNFLMDNSPNNYLRSGEYVNYGDKRTPTYSLIRKLDSTLDKLPDYITSKPLYRGIGITTQEFDSIVNNNYLITQGYLSTSKSKAVVRSDFLSGNDDDYSSVLLQINSNSGKDISSISSNMDEMEVLFPRGTIFKINSVQEINNNTGNYYYVKLDSIDNIKADILNNSDIEKRRSLSTLRRLALNNNEYYLQGRSITDPKKRQAYYRKGLQDLQNRGTFYNINNITNF